ncbi:MAG: hypothetical protein IJ658_01765 [Kiritimatiellae bacterium]|nr:hypothetical protein [Kiritimatiellia bacterium]
MADEKKKVPRGVVVEFDFAAVDGAQLLFDTARKVLAGSGIDLTVKLEAMHLAGGNYHGAVAELFDTVLGRRDDAGEVSRALARAFADALTEKAAAAVTPSFKAFVKALADRGLKVVIATRASLDALRPALEGLDPELVVPYQEISVTYGNCKWDAWARAVNTNGLVNVLTVGVTGSGNGVKSALVAGLSAIGVVHDHVAYQDFGGADAVVEKLDAKVAEEVFRMLHL